MELIGIKKSVSNINMLQDEHNRRLDCVEEQIS